MAKLTSTDIYGSLYVQGVTALDSTLSATQFTSTIANGTAPLIVASSTLVTNLNADLLDGEHASYYAADSGVVHLAGAETITGIKTFSSTITGSITGNAGTVTNGLYSTGSYANPAWITSLAASKLTGTIPSAVLGNSTVYIGSTAVALNRASATLALTGVTNTNWDAAYTATNASTNANTASTIVKRDASGNFSAGTITASLSGNATSASKVNNTLIIRSDSGATEGTNLYTFDGSAAKTLNLLSGSNVDLAEAAGSITFSSPSLSITNGTGDYISDITVSGHTITEVKSTWPTFNQDTTGTAAKADTIKTVTTDTNANFYPTFVDSDNATAAYEAVYTDESIYYNPSTNTLNLANLTVTGNMSINNVEMISTSSGVVFEGATANDFETTLNAIDPTADRSILLPDASGTIALTSSTVAAVANSLTLKIDTGTTEGTDLYTFNGSAGKVLDFKSGTNVTLTDTAGVVTFSSPSLAKAADVGTGSFVTDVAVSGHTITLSKGNFAETTLSKVDGSGDYMSDITVSGHAITEVKSNFSTLTISTGLDGTSYKPNAATTISLKEITPGTAEATQGALWYHGITPEAGKFDGSTTNPSGTTRLNYGGHLYATQLYDNGARVLTAHPTVSAASSVNNSGRTYIQDITLDQFGHITGIVSATETVVDTDTHWTSKNIVGASGTATANAIATNGNVYLNHLENSTVTSAHKIVGSGATTVTSDASGNITISSTDTNTIYTHPDFTLTQSAGIETTLTDITLIDSLTTNSTGHLTGATWRKLVAGTNVSITPAADGNITIASTDTNTATHADGIMDGSNTGTQVSYEPYSTQQARLSFDTSGTNPTRTDRLNLNGYLYATKLYSGGSEVLTAESDTLASVTGRGATTATAISLTNATASTTTGTGALIVTGGVGIGGAANIGGTLTTGNRVTIDYSATGGDGTWDKSGLLIKNMNASSAETAIAMQNASTTASNYWIHGLNQSADYKFAYGNGFTDGNVKFAIDINGNLSTPAGSTNIRKEAQSGTNIAGGNLTIMSGAGTGSATGSTVVIQTPTATTSGATVQSLATRVTIGQTDTTIANNLIVSGNLTINGTTTTINSTNKLLADPILSLGGTTTLTSNDSKDRGIEFRHFNVSEKFGFFGYDNSLQRFTFLPEATNTSEVFSGNTGIARFAKLELGNLTGNIGIFETLAASTDKTYTFPNASGTVALTSDLHTRSHAMTSTSDHTAGNWKLFHSNGSGQVVELGLGSAGQVLKSNGAAAAPSWQADNNTTAITWGAGTATSGMDKISFLSKESTDITAAKYTTLVAGTNVAFNVGTAGQLTISSTDTNTLNTAGATDTSSKIFLVGATAQTANPQTYTDNEVYVTSGTLTTKEVQVGGTAATMKYDSTSKSIKFVFA